MKIDFHTHGKLAKNFPFSEEYTINLLRSVKEYDIDAICVTEHFNSKGFRKLLKYIRNNYEKNGDCYLVEGIKVFIGMEVDIYEQGHIIIIGNDKDIEEIHYRLEPYMSGPRNLKHEEYMRGNKFINALELIKLCDKYNVIIGTAHPYRRESKVCNLEKEFFDKVDYIELNGKDCGVDKEMREKVEVMAKKYNKPIIAGSDTHQSVQYGCIWNDFKKECITIKELKEEIAYENYTIGMLDYINFKVKVASIIKELLKDLKI